MSLEVVVSVAFKQHDIYCDPAETLSVRDKSGDNTS